MTESFWMQAVSWYMQLQTESSVLNVTHIYCWNMCALYKCELLDIYCGRGHNKIYFPDDSLRGDYIFLLEEQQTSN